MWALERFFVIVNPPQGGAIPKDLKIDIAVQPLTGRLPEKRYGGRIEHCAGSCNTTTKCVRCAGDLAHSDDVWKARKAAARRWPLLRLRPPDSAAGTSCGSPRPSRQ